LAKQGQGDYEEDIAVLRRGTELRSWGIQMAEYIEVEEAIGRPGLRVVVGQGRPGPWNEAVKGILYVKKIPFVRVRQEDAPSPNLALLKWDRANQRAGTGMQ
jgi:hypothetical protein